MGKHVEIKTKETNASVEDFINGIADETRRRDSLSLLQLMKEITNKEPKMWGSSMIGFGYKRYKSPNTGREVDWFELGFSPRKANLSLHLVMDLKQLEKQLQQLGKHKTGAGCLYINKLADVDVSVLKEIIQKSC